MAKRPIQGLTKTRLCPPLSHEKATGLYECFLKDTIDIVGSIPGVTPFIAWAPPSDEVYFRQIAPGFQLLKQEGQGLGERLNYVLTHCSKVGFDQVIAINSDSPTLPGEYLSKAFAFLDDDTIDIVLGPTEDGGYYAIGWKRPNPRLISEVTMSTSHVLEDTLSIAQQECLGVSLLPPWYDVDEAGDLIRVRAEILANPSVGKWSGQYLDDLAQAVDLAGWTNETG